MAVKQGLNIDHLLSYWRTFNYDWIFCGVTGVCIFYKNLLLWSEIFYGLSNLSWLLATNYIYN